MTKALDIANKTRTDVIQKAQFSLTGGGTISVSASNEIKWTSRFITIPIGRGAHGSTSGYFDIDMPAVSTVITGVGGATNVTVTSTGIPLSAWKSLYYILPLGSGSGSVTANFRVVSYTSAFEIPDNWLLLCTVNGDNNRWYFNNGYTLKSSTSIDTNAYGENLSYNADLLDGQHGSYYQNAGNLNAGNIPDARLPPRLGTLCQSVTDWNAAVSNGYYMANPGTNAPTGTGWYIGHVLAHTDRWVTQTVWQFNDNSDGDTETWRRESADGGTSVVWGPWVRVWQTEGELDARYVRASIANTYSAGNTFSATNTFTAVQSFQAGIREFRNALPANDINLNLGNYFTKTISGNTTFTVSNIPSSGNAFCFVLDLTNGASATITWFSGIKWPGGVAPTLTASGRDVLTFFTHDGGTTWTGILSGKDVK